MADASQPARGPRHSQVCLCPERWTGEHAVHLPHEALLTLARKVHAAADDDDPQRLEQAALHLFDALATHVRDEDVTMGALSPALVRILGRGQERLLSLAAELAAEAAAGCTSTSELCRTRTEELLALLVLQARDEHVAPYDPAA